MRLYLSGDSKLNIAYYPDTLIVGDYIIDLLGDTDGITEGLFTRTKGDFTIRHKNNDDYRDITKEDIEYIRNYNGEFVISIYPFEEREENKLNEDIVEGEAELYLDNEPINFKFFTEFYGI